MAAAELRPKIRLWTGDTCIRLCRLIRHPVQNGVFNNYIQFVANKTIRKDSSSNLIVSTVIPAIAYLRTAYPLKLTMFFPTLFLDNFLCDNEVDLTDFTKTDTVMDQLYIMQ